MKKKRGVGAGAGLLAVFARGQRIRVTEACLELPSRLERNIVEAQDLVPGLALIDGRQQAARRGLEFLFTREQQPHARARTPSSNVHQNSRWK